MQLIDGKKIASQILDEVRGKIARFSRPIGLAFVLVGENLASKSYVSMKKKACAEVGIRSSVQELPVYTEAQVLLEEIERLNRDPLVDGILVQLPLPSHLNALMITRAIDPGKDIDGFHPINMGKLLLGEEGGFIPCTPRGIHVLLKQSQIEVEGKHVVIVGRSSIVGKPLAMLLAQKRKGCNATVTLAHRSSQRLGEITRQGDILVAAVGHPKLITGEMVKEEAVVVDVGINRLDGRIVGDVDADSVASRASFLTPVPGGVGPMTIALLMQNTYESAVRRHQ
jgi:methylenetetrahydrofolate dehydrogenase (NADP+) / methenyltetrahydrofolate cyclohydrolase